LRVVLDTNVLLRAHDRRPSRARALLDAVQRNPHRLVLSSEILVEMVRVLRYPRFQQLYGFTDEDLLTQRQRLESTADMVDLNCSYVAPLRDPSDLMVLQTADEGDADLLVTADPDFYDDAVLCFCQERGIDVCTERMALARLSGNLESNDHP
jgi:putative PIN family toxin of toxin-antitoxin system